jgi:hypothetical protein
MEDIIEIPRATAVATYKKADYNQKQLLKQLFGESFLKTITDRIKTFEDACDELTIIPDDVLHAAHSEYLKNDINSINAYSKLIIIVRALNEGWQPDWKNDNQPKFFPWFDLSKGSGLVYGSYNTWFTYSTVGSRLCFKTRELAEYAAKQFKNIYEDFFLIK